MLRYFEDMTEPAGLFPAHPQRPDHDLGVRGSSRHRVHRLPSVAHACGPRGGPRRGHPRGPRPKRDPRVCRYL